MERNEISRCFMNILDMEHQQEYEVFNTEDLYNVLYNYMDHLISDETVIKVYKTIIENNKKVIQDIVNDQMDLMEYRDFTEQLRQFRRQYLMKR